MTLRQALKIVKNLDESNPKVLIVITHQSEPIGLLSLDDLLLAQRRTESSERTSSFPLFRRR